MEPAGGAIPTLVRDLEQLGVRPGDLIIVHSSFKSLGLPDVTPADVIESFLDLLGPDGTVMMPTFTYSCVGVWNARPYHPAKTPGISNGILTETLRQYPGALRSGHPTHSMAAIGKHAEALTAGKEGASALGRGSPCEVAIQLGAKILLLGVGNNRNSAMHYAEVVAELPYNDIPFREFWGRFALVDRNGRIEQVPLAHEYPGCSGSFSVADAYLRELGILKECKVAAADCMLMDAHAMVEAVARRLKREPAWLLCSDFTCEPCNRRKARLCERGLL